MHQLELKIDPVDIFAELNPKHLVGWQAFHAENPHVYELVKKYADQVRKAGRKKYSIAAIFERVRWHIMIETRGEEFKLNNNHRAFYARLLMYEYPVYDGFFEIRHGAGDA